MIKKLLITTTILTGVLFADGQNVATMTNVKASLEALIDAYYKVNVKQNTYNSTLEDINVTMSGNMKKLTDSMDKFKNSISKEQQGVSDNVRELKTMIYSNDSNLKKCRDTKKEDDIIKKYLSE